MTEKVYILLPVHNRKETTRHFIECLRVQTYSNYHLILIDDGSTDGTTEMVLESLPGATVITGTGSWWWAGSLQRGFDWLESHLPADTDFVLLINDDTTFANDYLECAVSVLRGFENAMLLSRIRRLETGEIEETGVVANLHNLTFEVAKEPREINCFSTRGLFLRWSAMKSTGGFHPIMLPHYMSDYEYTIRAGRKGLRFATTDSVWVYADLTLTGSRDIGMLTGWKFVSTLMSIKCPSNPIYWSSFAVLVLPARRILPNLARIWRDALLQILRQGVLRRTNANPKALCNSVKRKT